MAGLTKAQRAQREAAKNESPKPESSDIPKATQDLMDALDKYGVTYGKDEDYASLLNKLTVYISSLEDIVSNRSTASHEEAAFASFIQGTNLSDKDFLMRLFKLGIAKIYIGRQWDKTRKQEWYLFADRDADLKDNQIHERIRFSGINPVATEDLFKRDTFKLMKGRI